MEKMYMNLPTNVGKHLTKFIIHFMIKILSKLGLEENFFCLIKGIYKKQITTTYTHTILSINIILSGEILEPFLLFQYVRDPLQCNNTRKK